MNALPDPACRYGHTAEQVADLLGDRLTAFDRWMRGQTGAVCDGLEYDYEARSYRATGCGPHGVVFYSHDLRRFLTTDTTRSPR